MKLKPLYQKVIVRRNADPAMSLGGIVIPDTVRGQNQRSWTGTVVAVGEGRVLPDGSMRPCAVKVGDTVICPQYVYRDNNGVEHNADITITGPGGDTLYVVLEPDIHAVVEA